MTTGSERVLLSENGNNSTNNNVSLMTNTIVNTQVIKKVTIFINLEKDYTRSVQFNFEDDLRDFVRKNETQ